MAGCAETETYRQTNDDSETDSDDTEIVGAVLKRGEAAESDDYSHIVQPCRFEPYLVRRRRRSLGLGPSCLRRRHSAYIITKPKSLPNQGAATIIKQKKSCFTTVIKYYNYHFVSILVQYVCTRLSARVQLTACRVVTESKANCIIIRPSYRILLLPKRCTI